MPNTLEEDFPEDLHTTNEENKLIFESNTSRRFTGWNLLPPHDSVVLNLLPYLSSDPCNSQDVHLLVPLQDRRDVIDKRIARKFHRKIFQSRDY